jgi:8-oxo-dGTP diphosphatase
MSKKDKKHKEKKAIKSSVLAVESKSEQQNSQALHHLEQSIHHFDKPSVTIDCVVFSYDLKQLNILLVNRKKAPYEGSWALPGGFLHIEESFEACVKRVLATKTGMVDLFMQQLYTFGNVQRDERGRVISVAYFALVNPHKYQIINGFMNHDTKWFPYKTLPTLAFDHAEIVAKAYERLQNKIRYQPIGFELLNQQFTLPELQRLYEIILNKMIDRRNFRKKMLELGIIRSTGERREDAPSRQPDIYQFDKNRYDELISEGMKIALDFKEVDKE